MKNEKPNWLLKFYQASCRALLPKLMGERAIPSFDPRLEENESRPLWFHVASVGELESLWHPIEEFARLGVPLVVTAFSRSAEPALNKLETRLGELNPGSGRYWVGLSPLEGQWEEALSELMPLVFITAKYEAWPELWSLLAQFKIRLVIIGAQSRPSLRWISPILKIFRARPPKLTLGVHRQDQITPLRALFPEANIQQIRDPRWDRIYARQLTDHERVKGLKEKAQNWTRPWGVLGSIWLEDLEFWAEQIKKARGTLWLVPHEPSTHTLLQMDGILRSLGVSFCYTQTYQSSSQEKADPKVVMVNEKGFLSELYRLADWAFVGGGFSKGVHNTMEPAINGIPIASGPNRASFFPEIAFLEEMGQLKILRRQSHLKAWLKEVDGRTEEQKQIEAEKWQGLVREQLGGAKEVRTWLLSLKDED